MASINITEREFEVLAYAADKLLATGDQERAYVLDDLARKANVALSNQAGRHPWSNHVSSLTAADVESPLESAGLRERKPKEERKPRRKRQAGQTSPELTKALGTLMKLDPQTEGWIQTIKGSD